MVESAAMTPILRHLDPENSGERFQAINHQAPVIEFVLR